MVHKVLCVYLPVDRILRKNNTYFAESDEKVTIRVGDREVDRVENVLIKLGSLESISKARSRGIWFGCDLSSLDLSRLLLLFIHG
ncbi:hypothetical protein DY000_02008845 [Brassica cretica]|uniref:Uncharacterized protein n=1 Tax=Brassica cretica TaxID=69181 RepID=A0ABQ7BSL1_BRACR|nr:hypothetical protein DY000_02008845 [Brassica cretica]